MNITKDAISILLILVPGYVACVTFRSIIGFRKHESIFWIFEILTFSLIIYYISDAFGFSPSMTTALNGQPVPDKSILHQSGQLSILLFIAILCGIALAFFHEKDFFMKIMRKIRLTTNTIDATAWQAAFRHEKRYISVHLKDGRRVYGHPLYYTGSNDEKYVYIYKHAWLDDNDECIESDVHGILIKEDNIHFIEFQFEKDEKRWSHE